MQRIETAAQFETAFGVSRETTDRFATYAELLNRWSNVQDLVAPGTLAEVWHRHFADSAQLLALAPEANRWLDLGSGAGFPGLVLGILGRGREGFEVHLVESNSRKCAFLRDVARQTGAPVEIHNHRIEKLTTQVVLPQLDVVTARALAPVHELLTLAASFMGETTKALFLKGRKAEAEVDEALRHWRFRWTAHRSRTDEDGRIIEICDLAILRGE